MVKAILFTLALAFAIDAVGDDSDIDPQFGDNGLALGGITDGYGGVTACRPVVQPDGKILICGTRTQNDTSGSDFFVARFTADGELDPDFSFDGTVGIDFAGSAGADTAKALALQANGRIVVVGTTSIDLFSGSNDFAIARLTGDGSLDPTFGAGSGRKIVGFDLDGGVGNDDAADVAIQTDGRIIVAGSARTADHGRDFAITRLLADGTPDPAFNLSGKVTVPFDLPGGDLLDDIASRVAVDASGRIVVAGTADDGGSSLETDFAIVRLQPNGQPDPDFSSDGRTTVAFDLGASGSDICYGMTIQRDGNIVLTGNVDVSPSATVNADVGVARLLPDGSPDNGFGIAGKTLVTYDLTPNGADFGLDVIEQDARLLIVGAAQYGVGDLLATATRLDSDGAADPTFGALGKRSYDLGIATPGTQAFLGATRAGPDVLVGGVARVVAAGADPIDYFVVRLHGDDIFANGFE